jgi:hypothetical protein
MIKLQGKYEFDIVGDGESNVVTVNLLNFKTPEAFKEGIMPSGVGTVTGRNLTGAQIEFPIDGRLDGTKLNLTFQGAPLAAVRVVAHLLFAPANV